MKVGEPFNPYWIFGGIFIPNCVLQNPNLSSTAKLCWGCIVEPAKEDEETPLNQETLATKLGESAQQISRALKELENNKFITQIKPHTWKVEDYSNRTNK